MRVAPRTLVAALLCLLPASCQLFGDIGAKTFSPRGDGGVVAEASRDAPVESGADVGGPPPLPADCHTLDPLYDRALWRVPADGPDGTNYEVDKAHGTVLDLTTKLMWQAATDTAAGYEDAECACRHLRLGGFDNWRMPSLLELVTIVDYAKNIDPGGTGTTVPATNSAIFPDTQLETYWTATAQGPGALGPGFPFVLDFSEGNTADTYSQVDAGPDGGVPGKDPFRCVRSTVAPPSLPRFDTSNPDVVIDLYTSLEWQKIVSSTLVTPLVAAGDCARSALDGHHDWRVPTVKELASLFDFDVYPAFDPKAFPNAPSLEYVTASVYGADPTETVWAASGTGDILIVPSNVANSARCVRTR
jgi:hypothetical protein